MELAQCCAIGLVVGVNAKPRSTFCGGVLWGGVRAPVGVGGTGATVTNDNGQEGRGLIRS